MIGNVKLTSYFYYGPSDGHKIADLQETGILTSEIEFTNEKSYWLRESHD